MSPVGKVTCKVLTNRYIHTFLGMIGYCLKDAGTEHFQHCMHNVSDEDVMTGKTLHTIYGRADSKQRVTLTNKNITDRMYVWFKYRSKRQLTATFLTTLTDMIQSGIFIPSAAWIIPLNGQGMDYKRITCLWKCITEPQNVTRTDVHEIFIKKCNFVKGRYFDGDESGGSDSFENSQEQTPVSGVEEGSNLDIKPSPSLLKSALKHVSKCGTVLFEDCEEIEPVRKSVTFDDKLGSFIALKDKAKLIDYEYLNTSDAQGFNGRRLQTKGVKETRRKLLDTASDGVVDLVCDEKASEIIDLSSDSDDEIVVLQSGRQAYMDRTTRMQKAPRYLVSRSVLSDEPRSPGSRCSG